MRPKKSPAETGPIKTQEKPTAPRPRDAQGRELDQWGLPFAGPARVRLLAEMGKPDPNFEPEAWADVPAADGAGTTVIVDPVAPVTEPKTETNDG